MTRCNFEEAKCRCILRDCVSRVGCLVPKPASPRILERHIEQACTELPLSRGLVALVDPEDYARLSPWKWHALKVGKKNGRSKFYAARTDYRTHKCILMHREIMGAAGSQKVDHIDADMTLDNRRANLRLASNAQNSQNQRKRPGLTSSRFKGVAFQKDRGSYGAAICANGKRQRRGAIRDEVDAATIYNFLAEGAFGEFARLNTP